MAQFEKTLVISLGGSLIAPAAEPDAVFLKKFRSFALKQVKKRVRLAIVAGGGRTCRVYQAAGTAAGRLARADSDWIGIMATRLNAMLVKAVFGKTAFPDVLTDPDDAVFRRRFQKSPHRVLIAGGWKPGWSTDYVAVVLAERLGAPAVLNLSDIDYVYTRDPKKFPGAKPVRSVTWPKLRSFVRGRWRPGLNAPFDPVASARAEKNGLFVHIVNGRNFANIGRLLRGEPYKGTRIGPAV